MTVGPSKSPLIKASFRDRAERTIAHVLDQVPDLERVDLCQGNVAQTLLVCRKTGTAFQLLVEGPDPWAPHQVDDTADNIAATVLRARAEQAGNRVQSVLFRNRYLRRIAAGPTMSPRVALIYAHQLFAHRARFLAPVNAVGAPAAVNRLGRPVDDVRSPWAVRWTPGGAVFAFAGSFAVGIRAVQMIQKIDRPEFQGTYTPWARACLLLSTAARRQVAETKEPPAP